MSDYIQIILEGNTFEDYLIAFAVFLILSALGLFFQKIFIRRLEDHAKKTKTRIDDLFVDIVRSFRPAFYYFVALYITIKFAIVAPEPLVSILDTVFFLWIVFRVVTSINIAIDFMVAEVGRSKGGSNPGFGASLLTLKTFGKGFIWAIAFTLVLSNFGINVSALVTGLGIGGLAFAFASQKILSDLFSSLVILFDRPFNVGDYITFGDYSGTVKKIGLYTTRIEKISGEELSMSNEDMLKARVSNTRELGKRRVAVSILATHRNSMEKLESIPCILEDAVKAQKKAEFDRATLVEITPKGVRFEVLYYVVGRDYKQHLEMLQAIYLNLLTSFREQTISVEEMQKVILNKEGS